MKTIVHISSDFPDPIIQQKTRAVQQLFEGSNIHRHVVYSLNRLDGLSGLASLQFGPDRTAVVYAAPPRGILMRTRLEAVARWIAADLERSGVCPDLVHTHKLTVEGVIGLHLAKSFDCRMTSSIRGDSDMKVLSVRRDLWPLYAELVDRADGLMSISRWPLAKLRSLLGPGIDRCAIIPSVSSVDKLMSSAPIGAPRLVSVFHLDSWQRKGMDNLARAAAIVSQSMPDLSIDIFGAGGAKSILALRRMLKRLDPDGRIRLMGPVPYGQAQDQLIRYAAFVMPSRRETYGMSYAEALFSGLPVIYSKDRGIDGMVPVSIGYACDPNDPKDLAAGIVDIIAREAEIKKIVTAEQAAGSFDFMRRDSIRAAYEGFVETVLSGQGDRQRARSSAPATASQIGLGLSSSS